GRRSRSARKWTRSSSSTRPVTGPRVTSRARRRRRSRRPYRCCGEIVGMAGVCGGEISGSGSVGSGWPGADELGGGVAGELGAAGGVGELGAAGGVGELGAAGVARLSGGAVRGGATPPVRGVMAAVAG